MFFYASKDEEEMLVVDMKNKTQKSKKPAETIQELSGLIEYVLWKKFPCIPPQDKEDISQEVKFKLCRLLAGGKKIINMRSYLKRVVFTTALDLIGGNMEAMVPDKSVELELANHLSPYHLTDSLHHFEKKELNEMLCQALDSLSRNRRIALKLHLKGMNVREIAEFMGWSISKTNHLFYRAIEDLKKKVGKSPFINDERTR